MSPRDVATHWPTNGATALVLAAFLGIAVSRGNARALALQLEQDFLGTGGQPAFWRWALAVIILYALASSQKLGFLFGPLFAMVLVAMLINIAGHQQSAFANLTQGIDFLFGQKSGQSQAPLRVQRLGLQTSQPQGSPNG